MLPPEAPIIIFNITFPFRLFLSATNKPDDIDDLWDTFPAMQDFTISLKLGGANGFRRAKRKDRLEYHLRKTGKMGLIARYVHNTMTGVYVQLTHSNIRRNNLPPELTSHGYVPQHLRI